jgi:hypothetical protein
LEEQPQVELPPSISIEYMETTMIEDEIPVDEKIETPTKKCKYNAKKFIKSQPNSKPKIKIEIEEKKEIQFGDMDMLTFYPEDTKIFEKDEMEEEEEEDVEFLEVKKKK